MADIKSAVGEIYSLEQLSGMSSFLHRRHALVKIIATLVFIIAVASFNRYEIGALVPYVFYPAVLSAISGTAWKLLVKRMALALPFVLLAGLPNIFIDRAAALRLGGFAVSYGAISFLSLFLRSFLCVAAVLLLAATTPLWELTHQLRRLRVPEIFITVFEMTYRYVGTLISQAYTMHTAYMLRSFKGSGLSIKHAGSFLGQMLVRSFDRAERVYAAMRCRGYALNGNMRKSRPFDRADFLFLAAAAIFCVGLRMVNIQALWQRLWEVFFC
ncbi:MAG: cobalt ECF transporter T component CbiQ [Oscillospiraceae bacterium]|jgi:cobalt/nickel transport system permease protein